MTMTRNLLTGIQIDIFMPNQIWIISIWKTWIAYNTANIYFSILGLFNFSECLFGCDDGDQSETVKINV